jgi:hypothetical protein
MKARIFRRSERFSRIAFEKLENRFVFANEVVAQFQLDADDAGHGDWRYYQAANVGDWNSYSALPQNSVDQPHSRDDMQPNLSSVFVSKSLIQPADSAHAVIAWRAPESGFYAIERSNISRLSDLGNGVDVHVATRGAIGIQIIQTTALHAGMTSNFNTHIGYMKAGDEIFVVMDSRGSGIEDDLTNLDFAITKTKDIVAELQQQIVMLPDTTAKIHVFQVLESGYYAIDQTSIRGSSETRATKLTIEIGDDESSNVAAGSHSAVFETMVRGTAKTAFDVNLGHLKAGQKIYVGLDSRHNVLSNQLDIELAVVRYGSSVIETNYRDDFGGPNWEYLWNRPSNWTTNEPGEFDSSPITAIHSLQPLIPSAEDPSVLTADGDLENNSHPSSWLRLRSNGGTPGSPSEIDGKNQYARYVVAAYTVENSGIYGLQDATIYAPSLEGDGINLVVMVNGDIVGKPMHVQPGEAVQFDQDIGTLKAGDRVFVAVGPKGTVNYSYFKIDYSIKRDVPRHAPKEVNLDAQPNMQIAASQSDQDDKTDDFADAFARAAGSVPNSRRPFVISLDAGHYYLLSDASLSDQLLDLSVSNVQIIGAVDSAGRPASHIHIVDRGQALPSQVLQGFLNTRDTSELVIANVSFDYDTPPFLQGHVVDITFRHDNRYELTFALENAMTSAKADYYQQMFFDAQATWGYFIDPQIDGRLLEGTDWHYSVDNTVDDAIQIIPGSKPKVILRVDYFPLNGMSPQEYIDHSEPLRNHQSHLIGSRFVFQARRDAAFLLNLKGARDASVINVTAYSGPSGFITAPRSSGLNVYDSHVQIKNGNWKSMNADSIHVQASRIGPWIENSSFAGVSDDIMNFYQFPDSILKSEIDLQQGTTSVWLKKRNKDGELSTPLLKEDSPGDHITIYDPLTGNTVAESRILQRRLEPLTGNLQDGEVLVVVLDRVLQLPTGTSPTDLYVYNKDCSGAFVISDSTLSDSRRYGNFLMASNGQLINNTYIGLGDQAIAGHNDVDLSIGLFSENILIAGNEFIENGVSRRSKLANIATPNSSTQFANPNAVIAFYKEVLEAGFPIAEARMPHFRDIAVLDNRFTNNRMKSISVNDAIDVIVSGNSEVASNDWQSDEAMIERPATELDVRSRLQGRVKMDSVSISASVADQFWSAF